MFGFTFDGNFHKQMVLDITKEFSHTYDKQQSNNWKLQFKGPDFCVISMHKEAIYTLYNQSKIKAF